MLTIFTKNRSRLRQRPICIILSSFLLLTTTLIKCVDALAQSSFDSPAIIVTDSSSSSNSRSHHSANLHEPRIALRYNSKDRFVYLDETSPNNTVLAIVFVADEDTGLNGETSVAIEGGNELGHFKLVSTHISNTIQVNGAPLSKRIVPEYNLTLRARDRGMPPKMSTVNLLIKLTSSPPAEAHEPPLAFKPPPISDLIHAGTMLIIIFSASVFFVIIGCALAQKPRGKKPGPLLAPMTTGKATNWNLDLYSL